MFDLFLVGGFIRDRMIGTPSKDLDFTAVSRAECLSVEAGFDLLVEWLEAQGVEIFVTTPEFLTARGRFPEMPGHAWSRQDGDFVLARKDGPSSDGRRPDSVAVGTLQDDLARRDFTVNAMAEDQNGNLIDPFMGEADLIGSDPGVLRFVGDPMTRIREDALRVMRGFRFIVTKGLQPTDETWEALTSGEAADLLVNISDERREAELKRMFDFGTFDTMNMLEVLPSWTKLAMFSGRVRLTPTLKKAPR